MKKVSMTEIPWAESRSPKSRFHIFRRAVSQWLGAKKDAGISAGGHPFDIEFVRIPPGAANWPYHSHSAQYELYVVISGRGEARVGGETLTVCAGDAFICAPEEAHQLTNIGTEDLQYCVVADNPIADAVYYPDSAKWAMKPARKVFRMSECDYFDGEE